MFSTVFLLSTPFGRELGQIISLDTFFVSYIVLREVLMSTLTTWQIARRLLGKILIDLRNTREEAVSVAELKRKQDHVPSKVRKHLEEEGNLVSGKVRVAVDSSRQTCSTDKSYETDDDDDKETQYRLDPK